MYMNNVVEAILYKQDLWDAEGVAARLARHAVNRGGRVEEVHITIRVISDVRLRGDFVNKGGDA